MIFYEVEIEIEEGVSRNCAIGILRDDIVKALPEDLVLVHRIIETMQERPEIFGYDTVSMDLMDNLTLQSIVEADLERTVNLQSKMAQDITDFMKSGLAKKGITVSMPRIITDNFIGGGKETIPLNQGPLIWMELARGEP